MSFQAMTWAVEQKVAPLAKLLLLTLANYADAENRCWPSKERLAADTGMSKASVCKYLNHLEDVGLVEVTRRTFEGTQITSVIRLSATRTGLSAKHDDPVRHTDAPLSATRTQTSQYKPIIEPREDKATQSPAFPSKADIDWAVELFNDMAHQAGIPRVKLLTDQRRRRLQARLKQLGSREEWEATLRHVYASDFCRGRNDRGWKADFDFVLQEKSFARLHEGFYANGGGP